MKRERLQQSKREWLSLILREKKANRLKKGKSKNEELRKLENEEVILGFYDADMLAEKQGKIGCLVLDVIHIELKRDLRDLTETIEIVELILLFAFGEHPSQKRYNHLIFRLNNWDILQKVSAETLEWMEDWQNQFEGTKVRRRIRSAKVYQVHHYERKIELLQISKRLSSKKEKRLRKYKEYVRDIKASFTDEACIPREGRTKKELKEDKRKYNESREMFGMSWDKNPTTYRYCSNQICKEMITSWKGCPCKKAWYCSGVCQKQDRKRHLAEEGCLPLKVED